MLAATILSPHFTRKRTSPGVAGRSAQGQVLTHALQQTAPVAFGGSGCDEDLGWEERPSILKQQVDLNEWAHSTSSAGHCFPVGRPGGWQ